MVINREKWQFLKTIENTRMHLEIEFPDTIGNLSSNLSLSVNLIRSFYIDKTKHIIDSRAFVYFGLRRHLLILER